MRRRLHLLAALVFLTVAFPAFAQLPNTSAQSQDRLPSAPAALRQVQAGAGPRFIENRGQWPDEVRFLAKSGGMNLWVTRAGLVYDLFRVERPARSIVKDRAMLEGVNRSTIDSSRVSGHVIRMEFVGAVQTDSSTGLEPGTERYNYFLGNDPKHWASDVPAYSQVVLRHLYSGIDARIYTDRGTPRYDLMVAPGADISAIGVKYEGSSGIRINAKGELTIATSMGDLKQTGLYAYQEKDGRRKQVACSFAIRRDGTVGFTAGAYDRSRALVIDPLIFCTMLTGGNDDVKSSIQVDSACNVYSAHYVWGATFPTTSGAYSRSFGGGYDMAVTKLDSSGSRLIFSTYLGGNGTDWPSRMILDAAGNIYVAGQVTSSNFPVTSNAIKTSGGPSRDGFVLKLNPTGSSLLYSTYIGGNSNVDEVDGLAIDGVGNIYICGSTQSSDLQKTPGAYDTSYAASTNNQRDGFAMKISGTNGSLVYGTYLGGNGNDDSRDIRVDNAGYAYVVSNADSSFPTTSGAYSVTGPGIVVTKINPTGSSLVYSTFIGPAAAKCMALDNAGNVYVAGGTTASNYPTTPGAYSRTFQNTTLSWNGVISKINANGTGLVFSTYFGYGTYDTYIVYSMYVDTAGTIYVAGAVDNNGIPTTPNAFRSSYLGPQSGTSNNSGDCWVARLDKNASRVLYGTYFGTAVLEDFGAMTVNRYGDIYIGGFGQNTSSSGFPVTSGAYDVTSTQGSFIAAIRGPRIVVNAPNGGEKWCAGNTERISWTTTDFDTVDVELSIDGGRTFPTVLASKIAPANKRWDWNIPASYEGFLYRVRVKDAVTGMTLDISDSNFSIRRPIQIVQQPVGKTICAGDGIVSFNVVAIGTNPTYQWKRNGARIDGATSDTYYTMAADTSAGNYTVDVGGGCEIGTLTSDAANLTVYTPPSITSDNPKLIDTICAGYPYDINFGVKGDDLHFKWLRDGVEIPGQTDNTFHADATTPDMSGAYQLIVTSGKCTDSVAKSKVVNISVQPMTEIIRQPRAQSVCLGDSVGFSVGAVGGRLQYTWWRDGKEIGHDSVLIINPVKESDAGQYQAFVKGRCGGEVTSQLVDLEIKAVKPNIFQQPQGLTVAAGQTVILSVGADGGSLTYQWRKNEQTIPGATAKTYKITSAARSDAGYYDCIVTNGCGISDTTLPAMLAVNDGTGAVPMEAGEAGGLLTVRPNPVTGSATVTVQPPPGIRLGRSTTMVLIDARGAVVADLSRQLAVHDFRAVEIDGAALPSGVYVCRVAEGAWAQTTTVTIVH